MPASGSGAELFAEVVNQGAEFGQFTVQVRNLAFKNLDPLGLRRVLRHLERIRSPAAFRCSDTAGRPWLA